MTQTWEDDSTEEPRRQLRRKLEGEGITDLRVLEAMQQTRRDLFVPDDEQELAYQDTALGIGFDQTISQPFMVALMTEALRLEGDERVLEIGTGSGYQAAILSPLCREVVTVERIAPLSATAQARHMSLGLTNIVYRVGDGTLGCEEFAPYDAIVVTAGAPAVPEALYQQLKVGGRLVIPVGDESLQELICLTRAEQGPKREDITSCRFVKLIGREGWQPERRS